MRSVLVVRTLFGSIAFVLAFTACEKVPLTVLDTDGLYNINGSEVYVRQMSIGRNISDAFSKEPLFIVHGGPVMDHSYFLPYLTDLAKDYQLVFYDQRACGKSSADIDSATMNLDGFIEDIELLRQELGFDKINLLGHSWGGMLATRYAIKYSSHLNKLVLSSPIAPSSADWQRETRVIGERATEQDLEARSALISSGALQSDDPREAVRTLLLQSFKYQMYDTANLAGLDLFVPIDYMHRSRIFGLLSADLASYDLYGKLGSIECPTLLVYGETEPGPSLYVNKILSAMKQAEMKVIPKSGHFPFVEEQAAFNKVILDFLN